MSIINSWNFAGGSGSTPPGNDIDYITISTLGNAADFGDLSTALLKMDGCSNSVRALSFGGG